MDTFSKTQLEDHGLKTAFHKVFDFEAEHIVELALGLVQHTNANKTADQSIAFKESSWVFLFKCEKLTSCLAELAQCIANSPDFSLVTKTIATSKL